MKKTLGKARGENSAQNFAENSESKQLNAESQLAKLFMNGRSQAVRLPKEFRFEGEEVYIHKDGDRVILSSKKNSWKNFFELVPKPSHDFMSSREDLPPQEREIF